jgi:beta-lactamase class A
MIRIPLQSKDNTEHSRVTPQVDFLVNHKKALLCTLCLFLLAVGCTNINPRNPEDTSNSQTSAPSGITTSSTSHRNELRDQIEQISRAAQGQVGVTATVLETGESVALNGDQRFPMLSVYKFPIAMAVLAQVDQGNLKLDQQVRVEASDIVQGSQILDQNSQGMEFSLAELLKYMVSESDNTACDVLLRLIGGPEVATQYLRDLDVNDIVVANTEKELGQDPAVQYRNYATPDAAVVLLRAFHQGKGLSESSQALLRRLMTETPTGIKRIKGLLPTGTAVAHKTGTSRTVNGITAATNDVGLVTLPNERHVAIAVFISNSRADGMTREAVIAKVARAAWDEWSR